MPILTNEAILGVYRLMGKPVFSTKLLFVSIAGYKGWVDTILYGEDGKNKGVEEVKNGDDEEDKKEVIDEENETEDNNNGDADADGDVE